MSLPSFTNSLSSMLQTKMNILSDCLQQAGTTFSEIINIFRSERILEK